MRVSPGWKGFATPGKVVRCSRGILSPRIDMRAAQRRAHTARMAIGRAEMARSGWAPVTCYSPALFEAGESTANRGGRLLDDDLRRRSPGLIPTNSAASVAPAFPHSSRTQEARAGLCASPHFPSPVLHNAPRAWRPLGISYS